MTSAAPLARGRRGPGLLAVAALAACVFLVVLTLLALQLRAGHDPALGTVAGGAAVVSQPAKQAAPAKGHLVSAPVTRSSGG